MRIDKDVLARLRTNSDFQHYMEALDGVHSENMNILVNAPPDKLQLAQGMARATLLLTKVLRA